MEHAGKLNHWLHASMRIQVVLANSCAYLLLQQQHNFYCCFSPICMEMEKTFLFSFFFPLITASFMCHGTQRISGELALRHFLSCLLPQFRLWDRVSLCCCCCCCREPRGSVAGFWNETDRTKKAIYKKWADNCWKGYGSHSVLTCARGCRGWCADDVARWGQCLKEQLP